MLEAIPLKEVIISFVVAGGFFWLVLYLFFKTVK